MNANLQSGYRYQRKLGFRPRDALRNARVIERWNELGGVILDEWEEGGETVRLKVVADQHIHDDSYLETWGLSERQLENEREDLWDRIRRDGLWGIVAQYWDGAEWIDVDDCWDFIGDDWRNSGYDVDAMEAAIVNYEDHREAA